MKFEFNSSQISDVILIVVFAPVTKEDSDYPARFRLDSSSYAEGEIPIHHFTLEQFSLLLRLMDTLPDFLLYLMARWSFHQEKLIPQNTDPIDEWALVTFERKRVVEILQNRTFVDLTGLYQRHEISLSRLERREKLSYLIDNLIAEIYASIGSTLAVDSRFNLLAEPNSLNAFRLMIPHLAKLDRDDRRMGLSNVAIATGLKLNAKTVLGLAVGHDWPESPRFDVIVADVSKANADADFLRGAEEAFGKVRVVDN